MYLYATYDEPENGAANQVRTGDLHVGNVTLYQLSYCRIPVVEEILIYIVRLNHASGSKNLRFESLFSPVKLVIYPHLKDLSTSALNNLDQGGYGS
jgi:hypothetical protein